MEFIIFAVVAAGLAYLIKKRSDKKKPSPPSDTQIVGSHFVERTKKAVARARQHKAVDHDLKTRIATLEIVPVLKSGAGKLSYGQWWSPQRKIKLSHKLFADAQAWKDSELYIIWVICHEIGHAVYGSSEDKASRYAELVFNEMGWDIPR